MEPVDVDCYGRIVARVRLGGIDISEGMVIDGYARAMGAWHPAYVAAEKRARLAQRGLWTGNPVSGIGDPAAHRRANPRRGRSVRGARVGTLLRKSARTSLPFG